MQFKAAVLRERGQALSIETVSCGALPDDHVLVRLGAAGLCHTDREAMTGAFAAPLPSVLGHEGAGVVERVGRAVTQLRPGDHVVMNIYPSCGQCFYCRRSQPVLCEPVGQLHRGTAGVPRILQAGGEPVHQFLSVSSFAQYCVVPQGGAIAVPRELPFAQACLLGCSVITGIGAVQRIARVQPGDSVAVVGCGPVGLAVIQGARLARAATIVAIDTDAGKLARARLLGATHALAVPRDDAVAQVRACTQGRGADHAFEAAGIHRALQTALSCARPGGTVTILGKTHADAEVALQFGSMTGEKRILRSSLGGGRARDDFPLYAQWYLQGELKLDELIDLRVDLDHINDGFAELDRGEAIRVVVDMDASGP
ncbi:Zn-dependent alcohol dehydrogenase [Pseudorhodoferax sp.]|uniref:Zn-dependent alcohol dehydrogenase n=1 Tax=Pseudorhodoferax sp. TaxID=1993553 RepID=UPI002DD61ECF|nr:Zn-dependent alcohol dehydrogenase [Pseudorhodoferax sp.]